MPSGVRRLEIVAAPAATVTWIKDGSLPRVLAGMGLRCTVRVMAGVLAPAPSLRSTMPKAVRNRHVTPATTIAFRRVTMSRPGVGFSPGCSATGLPLHGPVRDKEGHSHASQRQRFIDTLEGRGAEVENLRAIVSFYSSISLAVTSSFLEAVCRCSPAAWRRGPSRRRPLRQGAAPVVRP